MSDRSNIEWTDASWTPIRARNLATGKIGWYCEHATTGCEFCYAESMNRRLGTGLPFKPGHRKDVEIFLDEKMLTAPLRWKRPRMVFVCSMTDLFADFVKDEWLDRIFAVMALCPQHTFQVLSKRAERMRDYFGGEECLSGLWPPPNVWLGVSCERQQEADERIPLLLQTPAAIKFISAEPLLGPIDLTNVRNFGKYSIDILNGLKSIPDTLEFLSCKTLDWVIVGGESGRGARPMKIEWVDDILAQCRAAGVPCFVKQLGAVPLSSSYPLHLRAAKGGDMAEWPDNLRVREMPA